MTNQLVGDVYAKIIEGVIEASKVDFEENGVSSITLQEMKQEWQAKLTLRGVAQMPWDPKPEPAPAPTQPTPAPAASLPSGSPNGQSQNFDANGNGARVKAETDAEYTNGYQQTPQPQGGLARAQQLVQQYGNGQTASTPQQRLGGLALPGQQPRPQGLQLPGQNPQQVQQQYMQQQQQQAYRQQQALQQQQAQPRIKVESGSEQQDRNGYSSQTMSLPPQTDGADDALDEWRTALAQRRAARAQYGEQADHLMRNYIAQSSSQLQSGLMMPLSQQPKRRVQTSLNALSATKTTTTISTPTIPQLDGDVDDDAAPADIKDEDDENAINSDLDDSDDDGQGPLGDEDEDMMDTILCTYDKVQRVKNKWKCTLKDGVMGLQGREWVFHKGTGEFEW